MFVERKFHRLALHNTSFSLYFLFCWLNQRYDELIRFILKAVELPHGESNTAVRLPNLTIGHEEGCAYLSSLLRTLLQS